MELSPTTGPLPKGKLQFLTVCSIYGIIMILITACSRLRLLSVPLERDEGGFAFIGQQLLLGIPPYESGVSMKFPGIHFAYALIMGIFGTTVSGIHFGLLLINLGTIYFLFLLAKKIMPAEGAAITVGTYAILSVSMNVLGVFAHATHFVMFFALAGIVSLKAGIDRGTSTLYLISGLCLGLSCTMKQNGIFFCLFATCYLVTALHQRPKNRIFVRGGLFGFGMLIPFLLIFSYFIWLGKFKEFWFWTVTYVLEYASDYGLKTTLAQLWQQLQVVWTSTWLFWLLGVAGGVIFCCRKRKLELLILVPGFLATSFFAMWPGSHFYRHYFILFLPGLSLLIGWTVTALPQSRTLHGGMSLFRWIYTGVLLIATVCFFYQERGYLFSYSVNRVSKMLYSGNPFIESIIIADYIKKNTLPGMPITVLGSEPQIYFYADRPSASDYLFMYSLTQTHPYVKKMQAEMISEIENARPEYIIVAEISTSWLFTPNSDMRMVDWADQLLTERYEKVGLAVLSNREETRYYWGKAAATALSPWGRTLSVYRKLGADRERPLPLAPPG